MQVAAAHIEKLLVPYGGIRARWRGGEKGERRTGSGTVTTALIETDITRYLGR